MARTTTLALCAAAAIAQPLPNTASLTQQGDLSAQMIAGIDRFFEAETMRAAPAREQFWHVELSGDRVAYAKSIEPNRQRFAQMIGLIDARVPNPEVEYIATSSKPAKLAETDAFTVYAVRWPALDGVYGEGLLLEPKNPVRARVVALPDADQIPEAIAGLVPGIAPERQYARRLAEAGCQVLVPTLVDRDDTFSGNDVAKAYTNHPHREWIYRQSFVLGRHIIGYEVQKVLAAVDWFARRNEQARVKIGVVGWAEGGLIALYSGAVDPRIDVTLVSGYFGPRERLWEEPIYRNVFGLLREFGDANLARLIAPRTLIVEAAPAPVVTGPKPETPKRSGAAPGKISSVKFADVAAEVAHAQERLGPFASAITLSSANQDDAGQPLAETTLQSFVQSLTQQPVAWSRGVPAPAAALSAPRPQEILDRQKRQVRDLEHFTQRQLQLASNTRDEFLWSKVKPTTAKAWHAAMEPYRRIVWDDMIGHYVPGPMPLNPRTRVLMEKPAFTGYEVMLDVLPDVYAWGYLLLPKGIQPGEKRPVVVTQHGVGGLPDSVVTEDKTSRAYAAYQAYAVRLAERGFIVFAPHNPYRGDHPSRLLQRKAQPLGKTYFAVILAQHERILDFLATLPNVDASRIAFYGLSYGGQSAIRLPILLDRYALSICSGDFNEWTWKNASTDFPKSYMYNNAYERPEFRMGLTFGYAEMVALLAPRPFMVERGHNDAVGIDEWVAYEYAKVRRLYDKLGLGDRTEIEFFNGPHTIHGVGTFAFLHKHLNWPERK